MEITDVLLEKIAKLAKLEFTEEEKEAYKQDFQEVLAFVSKLQEVDTEGVEPLIHMTTEVNHFREDKGEETLSRQEALFNSPVKDEVYFRVPKVLDKDKGEKSK